MATRKDRDSKTKPKSKSMGPNLAVDCESISAQERLPPYDEHAPFGYQVVAGTGEEIVAWLRGVPKNTRAILITFPNEASYAIYGPLVWHVAHKLPEIDTRIRRRQHLGDFFDARTAGGGPVCQSIKASVDKGFDYRVSERPPRR